MPDPILCDFAAPVAMVVLNRPERLNALDLESWAALTELFTRLDADDSIRCVVLCGAGKAFGAGADIAEFASERADARQAKAYGKIELGGIESVAACRHPVVAQIHGACVGGGLALALACDLRVCAASSRFGIPVNRLGLTMAYGELAVLQRVVGPAATAEVLLPGEVFDAERALQLGLVGRIVADDQLEAEVARVAGLIAERAPLVNRWHKKFIRRLQDPTPLTPTEIDAGYACFDTDDYRRGFEAFLDKRKPEFEGN